MQTIPQAEAPPEDVRRFADLLRSIGRQWGLRDPLVGEVAAESELSHSQFHVLMWLGSDGALTMGELARRASITEKTITGVIDRLEKMGLAQRRRDQGDRRVIHVVLTEQGGRTFAELEAVMQRRLARFLGLLDPQDRDALCRILHKLLDRMGPAAASTAAPGGKHPAGGA